MFPRFLSRSWFSTALAVLGAGAPAGAENFLTVNNQTSRPLSVCQPGPGSPGHEAGPVRSGPAPGGVTDGCPCGMAGLAPSHCVCLPPQYLITCTLDAPGATENHVYLVIRNLPEGAVVRFRGLTLAVTGTVPPGLPGNPESSPAGAQPAKDAPPPGSDVSVLDAAIQSELP